MIWNRYRKRPVVVEACKTADVIAYGLSKQWAVMPVWIVEAIEKGALRVAYTRVEIDTLEGMHTAGPDDMIIRGVQGELYPCKPDIFEKTYEVSE